MPGSAARVVIPGYEAAEEIYRSERTVVMRGVRTSDGTPVIIKTVSEDHHDPRAALRLSHEHEILRTIESPGIVRTLGMERVNGGFVLLLEDFGGTSLDRHIAAHRVDIPAFLAVAAQLADALASVHDRGIIHKDLNPSNILLNASSGKAKIADFGISSSLERETQSDPSVRHLEGTLPYISPEQTGRMNRSIDYRTDFYSLGATLYEMLLGWPPFQSDDPMELVHAHLARLPAPPGELNRDIPGAISAIVMKLLAKPAEDRYQTARGLKADIERCTSALRRGVIVPAFEPGEDDHSDRLTIDQRIYGRDEETRYLLEAFDRVCTGNAECLIVSGTPGIGKSTLLHEVYKPLTGRRGFFVSGKFEELQRNVPYAGFVSASRDLIRQILAAPDEELAAWKSRVLEHLGVNARVMIDLLPELEIIIGPQPPVKELPSAEAQNRIHNAICAFVRAVTRKDHPLVIFMDDLHWADAASLDLMRILLSDAGEMHLLFLGAYRERESTDALDRAIDSIEASGHAVRRIVLIPLDAHTTNQLIADSLRAQPADTAPLATLVYEKTDGNPFFVTEFLRSLHRERLLRYDRTEKAWKWDTEGIQRKEITDNVVSMLTSRIQRLTPEAAEALMTAACIGSTFELGDLASALEVPLVQTAGYLNEAMSEGLIFPVGDGYKYVRDAAAGDDQGLGDTGSNQGLAGDAADVAYKFTHDRVQQAAYSLVPAGRRAEIHYAIGSNLLERIRDREHDRRILDAVNQMNLGASSIRSDDARHALAALNLSAAGRAKKSGAFEAARNLFESGKNLLTAGDWERDDRLMFNLTVGLGECEYLTGQFAESEGRFAECRAHARGDLEKATITLHEVSLYVLSGKFDSGIDAGLAGLRALGLNISRSPGKPAVLGSLLTVQRLLRGRNVRTLEDLPPMADERQRMAIRILMALVHFAYRSSENLSAVVILKMLATTLTHGMAEESPYAFATYGLVLSTGLGRAESGCAFGELAVRVAERSGNPYMLGRCMFVLGSVLHHWKHDIREGVKTLAEGYTQSLNAGDLEYASYALIHLTLDGILTGDRMEEVELRAAESLAFVKRFKFGNPELTFVLAQRVAAALKGSTSAEGSLVDSHWHESEFLERLERTHENVAQMYYAVLTMEVSCLFGQHREAWRIAQESRPHLAALRGQAVLAEFYFYESLAICALTGKLVGAKRRNAARILKGNLRRLGKWSQAGASHLQSRYLLASAEAARVDGRGEEAMSLYDRAIGSATEGRFVQIRALAFELSARFHLGSGRNTVARGFLLDARDGYAEWGATGKVIALEREFPGIAGEGKRRTHARTGRLGSRTEEALPGALDLESVLKASQALSSEIRIEQLLEKLMQIVLENAGATRGVMILEEGSQLLVRAEGSAAQPIVVKSIPLSEQSLIPVSVIQFVARTNQSVLLSEASNENLFRNDAYVSSGRSLSLLCMPVSQQGKRGGILFLENTLTADAFTPKRLEVLRLLSAQIAISLENARLHVEAQAYARVQEEIRLAARIQTDLLPGAPPEVPGYEIAGVNHPAQAVGGDYYDFIPLGDGRIAICLGDVSGKGLPASLLMANLQATLRGQALLDASPLDCVRRANRLLWGSTSPEKFATLFYGSLDPGTHELRYVNAGQEIPIVLTCRPEPTLLDTGGVALGVVEEFDFEEGVVKLDPGDTLVVVSDGITEAMNARDEQFERERLRHVLQEMRGQNARMILERLIAEVRSFAGEAPQGDDITIVVVKRKTEA